uniref:LOX4 n=1 Tax=Arundo donax TaxID=35708 RepID=A0A0A9ETC9_ARUDO
MRTLFTPHCSSLNPTNHGSHLHPLLPDSSNSPKSNEETQSTNLNATQHRLNCKRVAIYLYGSSILRDTSAHAQMEMLLGMPIAVSPAPLVPSVSDVLGYNSMYGIFTGPVRFLNAGSPFIFTIRSSISTSRLPNLLNASSALASDVQRSGSSR